MGTRAFCRTVKYGRAPRTLRMHMERRYLLATLRACVATGVTGSVSTPPRSRTRQANAVNANTNADADATAYAKPIVQILLFGTDALVAEDG